MNRIAGLAVLLSFLCAPLCAQAGHKKKRKPTPTPIPTATPTPTPTPSASATPAPTPEPAQMINPTPGFTFDSKSVSFNWSAGSATGYVLFVGSAPNAKDLYYSGLIHSLSATVDNLPNDGRAIFVTLISNFSSSYATKDYSYTACSPEVKTPFDMGEAGEIKADPVRNRVYLIDQTTPRILAIDTTTGKIAAAAAIEGLSGFLPVDPANKGFLFSKMVVSPDATKLYVGVWAAKEIQVFSLPDLAPLSRLPSNFATWSLATGANNRLYAFSTDPWGICEVDPNNGLALHGFQNPPNSASGLLLRNNTAGTRLYAMEIEVWVQGGPGVMSEFDTTGETPALLTEHPLNMVYANDFNVDEQYQRLYTMNGGIYGIEQTDLVTDSYGSYWPLGDYAAAVTFLPNDTAVYGAGGGTYQCTIRKFNRADGSLLSDYHLGNGKAIMRRAIALTPNGNLIYAADFWHGCTPCGFNGWDYYVGILGRESLTLSNAPSNGGPANPTLNALNFSDAEGNNDGIPNSGEIVSFSPSFLNNGTQLAPNVTIDATVSSGATLLSAMTQPYGNIPPGANSALNPFRFQLDPSLAARSTVIVTFTAHWDTGQSKSFPYTIVIQ